MKRWIGLFCAILLICSTFTAAHAADAAEIQAQIDALQAQLDTLKQEETTAPQDAEPSAASVSVGDKLKFGSYQDEPIEWRVLDVVDGRALVISEYLLDTLQYHEKRKSVTWETCTLRKWLNDDFYNTMFTEAERARILETTLINGDNRKYKTKGGKDTQDRIFILSIDEAEHYFRSFAGRTALYKSGTAGWWWLRTPGNYYFNAQYVDGKGRIFAGSNHHVDSKGGFRPALWMSW